MKQVLEQQAIKEFKSFMRGMGFVQDKKGKWRFDK